MNPEDTPPISIPVPSALEINIEPLIRFLSPPIYELPPWNTNGAVIVSVLDISPTEFRYCIFNNFGSFKFSDGTGTFTLNDALYGTVTSFNNSNSPGNPSDLIKTFTLSTTPAIGSTFDNVILAKDRSFSVTTLEPLLTYWIL